MTGGRHQLSSRPSPFSLAAMASGLLVWVALKLASSGTALWSIALPVSLVGALAAVVALRRQDRFWGFIGLAMALLGPTLVIGTIVVAVLLYALGGLTLGLGG